MTELSKLKPGASAVIHSFLDDETACNLVSMGIIPGSEVRMMRKAPFGGACYIQSDTQQFALRNSEAACILVK